MRVNRVELVREIINEGQPFGVGLRYIIHEGKP
jgi:hypothetical protein